MGWEPLEVYLGSLYPTPCHSQTYLPQGQTQDGRMEIFTHTHPRTKKATPFLGPSLQTLVHPRQCLPWDLSTSFLSPPQTPSYSCHQLASCLVLTRFPIWRMGLLTPARAAIIPSRSCCEECLSAIPAEPLSPVFLSLPSHTDSRAGGGLETARPSWASLPGPHHFHKGTFSKGLGSGTCRRLPS